MVVRKTLGGFPCGSVVKESACLHGFDPWARKIPWSRKWQPAPVFLPGKFYGQSSLAGYSPWGHKGPDTTEQLGTRAHRSVASLMGFLSPPNLVPELPSIPYQKVAWPEPAPLLDSVDRQGWQWYDRQGLNFQNIQTAHATQYQKNEQSNQTMGRRQTVLQRRHTDGQ